MKTELSTWGDVVLLILFCMIFGFGVLIGVYTRHVDLKREAIKHNCAEYNQTTGKWQWKGK